MPLTAGTRLGPYEILSPLGAGGMGEVYRARDTRLHRSVAIKVIATAAAGAADFRQRFEREARAISALTHPHICALYDVGRHDGLDFLVLEYLEGETLAHRLQQGPLPPDLLVQCSIEIASALDQAHRRGIVHRDLKPANIMLTKAGVKLMDFGLAKLRPGGSGSPGEMLTAPGPLTGEGTILGTLQYMSPEQLEGRDADARADIFAFGSVVYEMATGRRAFEGRSQASLIAAILRSEPPAMTSLQPLTPKGLDRVVQKCLAKDPDERWQHAHDLLTALTWVVESDAASLSPVGKQGTRRRSIIWASAGLAAGVLATSLAVPLVRRPLQQSDAGTSRWTMALPPTQSSVLDPVLSPDGQRLVYSSVDAGRQMLFIRAVDQYDPESVRGTDRGRHPFLSPDGQWIGFEAGGQIRKVASTGGAFVTISDHSSFYGADWGSDDRIIFGSNQGLQSVSAEGGQPQVLIAAEGASSLRWPQRLPGGRHVLFVAHGEDVREGRIVVQPLGGGAGRVIGERASYVRYAAGYLVYSTGTTLMARPFDVNRLEATGPPTLVADDLRAGIKGFAVGAGNALVYLPDPDQRQQSRLVWVDRRGTTTPLPFEPGAFRAPRLSPRGGSLLLESLPESTAQSIWTADLDRAASMRRLTFEPACCAEWLPDGLSVVFNFTKPPVNLFRQAVDGSRSAERVTTSEVTEWPGTWTRNGTVVFIHNDPVTLSDIWALSPDGARTPVLQKRGTQWGARLSPNGRWVAYGSNESGAWEVYVTSFPSGSGQWKVSSDGGQEVLWSKDGGELFYRTGSRMMSVDVLPGATFQPSAPTEVFDNATLLFDPRSPGWPNYDVAANGRFLMLQRLGASRVRFNVILNWTRALERRAATRQ